MGDYGLPWASGKASGREQRVGLLWQCPAMACDNPWDWLPLVPMWRADIFPLIKKAKSG